MVGSLAAALAVCSIAAPAASSPSARAPEGVEITIVGAAEDDRATRGVVRELLGPGFDIEFRGASSLELSNVVTPVADARARVARVWIDLRAAERATIYIVDGPWERILVRHVPTPDGYGEIPREQVGHITGGAIEALAGGARIGLEREEAARSLGVEVATDVAPATPPTPEPTPEPRQSAPAPAPADVATWLWAAYSAAAFARDPVLTHGPTVGAAIELRRHRTRPNVGLTVHYGIPVRVTTPDVTLRLDTVGLRGRFALGPRVGPRVRLRPWVGAGIDLMRVDARARTLQAEPFPAFWTPVPMAELGFGVAIALRRAMELRVGVGAEIDLADTSYEFADSGADVFDPWVARAALHLGLAFDPLHWRQERG